MKHSLRPGFLNLFLLAILVVALTGCVPVVRSSQQITGSGKLITQEYDFSGFDSVDAGSNFQLRLQQGDEFAVSVTADDNVMPLLRVEKVGDKLLLDVKPGSYSFQSVTMKADVTLPALASLRLDGNVTGHVGTLTPADLVVELDGNAIVQGTLNAEQLLVDGTGNAQARLAGSADALTVKGQGNALLTLDGLTANTARVDLGSNAKAGLTVTGSLDYSLGGNAGLTYNGSPDLGEQKTAGNSWARGR